MQRWGHYKHATQENANGASPHTPVLHPSIGSASSATYPANFNNCGSCVCLILSPINLVDGLGVDEVVTHPEGLRKIEKGHAGQITDALIWK